MKPRGQLTERACPVGSIKQEVKSPVQMRFLEIQSVQEEMGALIAELEQRMDPCLCLDTPANDTVAAKSPPEVGTCDLGNRLVQIWERMQGDCERIRGIIRRIQF